MEVKSKGEQVYEILRQKIINYELKPRSRIIIGEIAKEIPAASEMLVREGLSRLVEQELVNKTRAGKYFVATISVRDVQEIFDLRRILEMYALSRVVKTKRINKDFQELKEKLEIPFDISDDQTKPQLLTTDLLLHRTIIQQSKNRRLQNVYDAKIFNFFILILQQTEHIVGDLKRSQAEHKALVDAILKKDPRRAKSALKTHLSNAEHCMVGHFQAEGITTLPQKSRIKAKDQLVLSCLT